MERWYNGLRESDAHVGASCRGKHVTKWQQERHYSSRANYDTQRQTRSLPTARRHRAQRTHPLLCFSSPPLTLVAAVVHGILLVVAVILTPLAALRPSDAASSSLASPPCRRASCAWPGPGHRLRLHPQRNDHHRDMVNWEQGRVYWRCALSYLCFRVAFG